METVGVVLAGGLSSRMQCDKSELLWQNKTLLEHTKNLLQQAGCQSVLVSDNKQQGNITDRFVDSGPLAGIEACLYHLLNEANQNAENILLMPIDMPMMTINLLSKLRLQSEADTATFYSLGRFPLILPIKLELLEWLTSSLKNSRSAKKRSIKAMLGQLPCNIITLDATQINSFYNCNTPEQWQTLQH